MSDFPLFKQAIALLAECSAGAETPEALLQALAARTDNPFHDYDFWAYGTRLYNAVCSGLEDTMNLVGDSSDD